MSDKYNAVVVEKEFMNSSIYFLRVRPDGGVADFTAGQYIALGLLGTAPRIESAPAPEGTEPDESLVRRTYSIGSSPLEKDHYEFYISLLPEGVLTPCLAALDAGDRLFLGKKPIGTFTLDAIPDASPVVFVATGTGVAPFVSILKEGSIFEHKSDVTLLHGVRFEADHGYADYLTELAATQDAFTYHQVVSRPQESWQGHKGYVQSLIENGTVTLDSSTQHFMLCGNPAMIDDLEKLLLDNGFTVHSRKEPGNLHMEKYW